MLRKLLALGLCLFAPTLCSADVIVQLGQGGVVSTNQTFTANAGGQLTLDIFLTQQGTDPANGILGDFRLSAGSNTRGLGSFYMEMALRNAGQALAQSGVRVANLGAFSFQNGFDGRSNETTFLDAPGGQPQAGPSSVLRMVGIAADDPADAGAIVLPRFAAAPFQVVVGPNTGSAADNSVLLGSVTFNIANDALGEYQVGFTSPGSLFRPSLGNDITTGFFDVNNFGNNVSRITVVPEPTTVALFSICAGGLGFARFRRKAAKK